MQVGLTFANRLLFSTFKYHAAIFRRHSLLWYANFPEITKMVEFMIPSSYNKTKKNWLKYANANELRQLL